MTPWVPSSVWSSGIFEPRLFQRDLLKLVQIRCLLSGTFQQHVVRGGEQAPSRSESLHKRALYKAPAIGQFCRNAVPEAALIRAGHVHLPEFLRQCHAGEQIFHPPFDGLRGIEVGRF